MAIKWSEKDMDFAHKVLESEGLGYSLESYYSEDVSEHVDSYFLAQLWQHAHWSYQQLWKTLKAIEEEHADGKGNY